MLDDGRKDRQNSIELMDKGGINAVFFTLPLRRSRTSDPSGTLTEDVETIKQRLKKPSGVELAYSADEVRRIHAAGKKAILFGVNPSMVYLKAGNLFSNSITILEYG